jgi:hypothetical protein
VRDGGGQKAERGDEHGHHDGAEAEDSAFDGSIFDGVSVDAHLVDVLEHDDAGLDGDAEEGEEADAGGDAEVGAAKEQGEQAAHRSDRHVAEDEERPLERAEHAIQDHEDKQNGDGEDELKAARAALLALVFAGPIEVIADGKLDLLVDLVDGFADGAAKVATADAVLDGDVAGATFAIDFFGTILDLDLGELSEGDAFT